MLKDICSFLYHKNFFYTHLFLFLENLCLNSLKSFLISSNFFLLILIFGFGLLSAFIKSFLDLFFDSSLYFYFLLLVLAHLVIDLSCLYQNAESFFLYLRGEKFFFYIIVKIY